MLIYSPLFSSRLQYILDFIWKETLDITYIITTNREEFIASNHSVRWSIGEKIEGYPCLPISDILFQTEILSPKFVFKKNDNITTLFDTNEIDGIDFDILGSAFFLISRYEEYLPNIRDEHGRFIAVQSVAFQQDFLETTMVNRYIFWLMKWIRGQFPSLELSIKRLKSVISIDIDHPFYSKDISLDKLILRSIKNFSLFSEKDKYDTYDFIIDHLENIPSIFFLLCPESPSDMDHFNRRESENFKNLIQFLRSKSQIGIHPSYFSEEKKLLASEIDWLSSMHDKHIKSSRFHYLKYDIETSFRELIQNDILYDFSMGYGTHCGFRTSTSLPFYYFDLNNNKATNLKIFTPCIMDSSFQYGMQTDFRAAFDRLFVEIKTYGGYFIPIFHNDILANKEWQENFKYSVEKIKQR